MKISQCNHFRIRDTNEYGMDVERFIKSIEKQYKMNFSSIPHWKELVKQLHSATTECKRKLQASKQRKTSIIEKIYVQTSRLSPFQLTDALARTEKTWKSLESKRKYRKLSVHESPQNISPGVAEYDEISGELSEREDTAHPNTEIVPSEDVITQQLKSEIETEVNLEVSHLPTSICVNQHKLISPMASQDGYLSFNSTVDEMAAPATATEEYKEWLFMEPTTVVKCMPQTIILTKPSFDEQCFKFSLVNCTTVYMHVRFKTVTEKSPFRRVKIVPPTPMRLYPGITVVFKMIFRLSQTEDFEPSGLYFKTGPNVLFNGPTQALVVPVLSSFKVSRKVYVPEKVSIAPAYSWHVNEKVGFPTALIKISNNNKCSYRLHIMKKLHDFAKEATDSLLSVNVISPNTESMLERVDDNEVETQSKIFSPTKGDALTVTDVESLKTIDIIALVVEEIVELALETFVFEYTYLDIHPLSKRYVPVYFTKVEHTGFHQCYYDFEFSDPETGDIIITKTTKIYAEVWPHPVKVYPDILDMSDSPITHGFCEDVITVVNTHKIYSVTVTVKLTKKMNKLFRITPMQTTIFAGSEVKFSVRLCSKSFASRSKPEDFAHFTFKFIFSGPKVVYNNVPPLFYEIIAPCALEFKSIYNEKFYMEVSDASQQEISCSKIAF